MFQSWDGISMGKLSIYSRVVRQGRKPNRISDVISHGVAAEATPVTAAQSADWCARSDSSNRVWRRMGP
eukprot:scaffold758_cov387-Pavlova_lutheri.AAC.6